MKKLLLPIILSGCVAKMPQPDETPTHRYECKATLYTYHGTDVNTVLSTTPPNEPIVDIKVYTIKDTALHEFNRRVTQCLERADTSFYVTPTSATTNSVIGNIIVMEWNQL